MKKKAAKMDLWNTLRLKSKDPAARCKAIESLAARGHARAIEMIVKTLADEDAHVRRAAVKLLESIPDEQSVEALMFAAQDASGEVREAAATALGQMRDPQATGPLAYLLNDPKDTVRMSAGAALKHLGWTPSTPEEQAAFEVATGNARGAVLAGHAGVKALVTDLKHDTSFKRRAAAEALQEVSDPRAR